MPLSAGEDLADESLEARENVLEAAVKEKPVRWKKTAEPEKLTEAKKPVGPEKKAKQEKSAEPEKTRKPGKITGPKGDNGAESQKRPDKAEQTEKTGNESEAFERGKIAGLQEAILAIMEKNGPVTDQMRRDVMENVYHDSLINWVKSFH